MKKLLIFLIALQLCLCCVHDQFIKTITPVFYDDTHHGRILQTTPSNVGSIRIFADYTHIQTSDINTINMIKRLVNISTLVFYNILTVERLDRLYYPADRRTQCSSLTFPSRYVTEGVARADLGILIGDEANPAGQSYIAKSAPCANLLSNKRPIWGIMVWNSKNLRYDQQGFQQIVYVSLHQITHILGFSSISYSLYPNKNLTAIIQPNGSYLSSPRIREEVASHFGCESNIGMPLQDQDGTSPSSHWERKVAFNEFMTASNSKNTILSRITLALLESMGWYVTVNYDYAEGNLWGKGKGCGFLSYDNCSFGEFCQSAGAFACDFDGTGIGSCKTDLFSNACTYPKYFTNTICLDPAYSSKNLNTAMKAQQTGGWNSRCFQSDFRLRGLTPTTLNFRCYQLTCSSDNTKLFIQIGNNVLVCESPGQILRAPMSLTGTLTCPRSFENYCNTKPTCQNNCNVNGICINGQCLCTGTTKMSDGCLAVELTVQQVGNTGGLLNSIMVASTLNGSASQNVNGQACFDNFVLEEFGDCMRCEDYYGCTRCDTTKGGCIVCDNGASPKPNGSCL